jgi:hypothetical protein
MVLPGESDTFCTNLDASFPQVADKLENEAREATTRAATEQEAATHAWNEEDAAALRRFISERKVGRLPAWPRLQGLVEFLD